MGEQEDAAELPMGCAHTLENQSRQPADLCRYPTIEEQCRDRVAMSSAHENPYRPPLEADAAPTQQHRAPFRTIPFVSGAVYATLCLGIFLVFEYLVPLLPAILLLLLIAITAPFYITAMAMISIGRNGTFEIPTVGWIAAFLVATTTHHLFERFRFQASKSG